MEITSIFIKKALYFESQNNTISMNLNWSKNYCLYSLKKRFSLQKIAINYLLSSLFHAIVSPYTNT